MFELMDKRYKVDGHKLQREREKYCTMSQFAYACTWSPSYQWKLENNYIDTIGESTKNVIEGVLNGFAKKK